MPRTFRTAMVSRPSSAIASRALMARLISAVSNCAMSATVKQSASLTSTATSMRPPTSGRTSCATPSTCAADVEDLRLQRLPAGKGQQLRGELGGALDGLGDGVDIAAAALLRQLAPAQEVGGRADDGEQIVEVVRDTAGELADRLHLLRLPQRFLAAAALGDVDQLRHRARDVAVAVEHGAHAEIEIALADGKSQPHLPSAPLRPSSTVSKAARTTALMPSVVAEPAACPRTACR